MGGSNEWLSMHAINNQHAAGEGRTTADDGGREIRETREGEVGGYCFKGLGRREWDIVQPSGGTRRTKTIGRSRERERERSEMGEMKDAYEWRR